MTLSKSLIVAILLIALPLEAGTWISLGVFSTRERATAFAASNRAVVLAEPVAGGGERYRVALGPFVTRAEARRPLVDARVDHPDAWLIERADEPVIDRPVQASRVVALPPASANQPPSENEPPHDRNHEDDEAPRGYGFHELRRTEDRRD